MTDSITPQARILAIVGMTGSGKTLCAQHLQAKGYYQFRFGSIVTDEVERRGWQVNPENEKVVREEFRANHGMDVMAQKALPRLHTALQAHQSIVIDGLYSFSEYKTLQDEFPQIMVVLAVVAARHLRYQRLAQRPIRPLTTQEAQARDWREIEKIEKGGPIAIADYTLLNDGESDQLLQQLDALMAKLSLTP